MANENKVYGVQPKVQVTENVKTETYNEIFTLVTQNKQTRIAIGRSIVSKMTFKTLKEAKNYIDQKPWELLINVICLVEEKAQEAKNSNNNQ